MKWFTAKNIYLIALVWLLTRKRKFSIQSAPNDKTLLWEISGNGLKSPSYFYGTMHLMCAEEAILSCNVQRIIKHVAAIYLEVDLNNADALLNGTIDLTMKENKRLPDLINPEDYELVRAFFMEHQPHLPFHILERQHPLMLTSSLYEFFLPCEQKNGIELRIVEEANRLQKPLFGLETLEFQTGVFDLIPYDQQAKELVKTIEHIDKFKQTMQEMMAVYKSQDLQQLHNLTMSEDSGINGHLDLLLYTRNNDWVEKFETIAWKEATLFAVGAGHLGGEQGLLDLLQKKGYVVRGLMN